eukprot:7041297-Heterocapsa_arctica.AAC.1
MVRGFSTCPLRGRQRRDEGQFMGHHLPRRQQGCGCKSPRSPIHRCQRQIGAPAGGGIGSVIAELENDNGARLRHTV